MNFKIALPSELGITPANFAAAWNEMPECREAAMLQIAKPRPVTRSIEPGLFTASMAVLGTIAAGVGTNALYDLIKKTLTRKGVKQQIEITQTEHPDGTRTLVVKIIAEQ